MTLYWQNQSNCFLLLIPPEITGFFLKKFKKIKKKKKKKKLGFLPMFFRNRETSALIIRKNTEKNTLTSGRNTLTSLFNKVARWTT